MSNLKTEIATLADIMLRAQSQRDLLKLRFGMTDPMIDLAVDVFTRQHGPTLRGMPDRTEHVS
jgi:hypothetical protein